MQRKILSGLTQRAASEKQNDVKCYR